MEMPELITARDVYTVYARDTPFHLSRSQIETDSPNYFTSAFLAHDFTETKTREFRVDQHPQLFALIVEHLSGYPILPLQRAVLPPFLSIETAQAALLRDAQFFALEQLEAQLEALLVPSTPSPSRLPRTISDILRGEAIYDLDRLAEDGDLVLDNKVLRPFHFSSPLPLKDLDVKALFLVKAIPMTSTLSLRAKVPSRQLQATLGSVSLEWQPLSKRSMHSVGSAFKLNGETLLIDTLEDAFVATLLSGASPAVIKLGSAEAYIRKNWMMPCPTLDVLAETLIVSIDATGQSQGRYHTARATIVYADLLTTEKFTSLRIESAIAVSI
ncbi:uncharacterized protein JCM15063_002153 [Sporobolomyces koalae]|uniref:uncharacterized protein n=1 Tax=Sporobolomyces koalae TaxID=500713 RepID=UPI003173315E